jgi:PAS domain S-box-containing protein
MKNNRLLLIEDNPADVALIEIIVTEAGRGRFPLEFVSRLSAGLEWLAANDPALILLDLSLPDSQGLNTLTRVRDCSPIIPVIVLTGLDDEELAMRALQNGAQDYLVKGTFDGEALIRSIRHAIERMRFESELAKQGRRWLAVMEGMPDVQIYFKDELGRYTDVNPAFARNHGLDDPGKMIGRTASDFSGNGDAHEAMSEEAEVVKTGRPLVGKVEKQTLPGGRVRWNLTTKLPLRDGQGRIVGTFGASRDISELKTAQMQLIQAEKLQSLGQMAAGVAHEVKNPLAILKMGVEYLAEFHLGGDEGVNSVIAEMKDAIRRGESVIREMLTYSSASDLDLREVAINSLIEQTLRFVRHNLAKGKVKAVTNLSQDLPPCLLDAGKMEQVFVNLLINACQAMSGGGTLTVTTSAESLDADDLDGEKADGSRPHFRKGDPTVVIEVRDTGTGIPEDKLQLVFDPFFTTKKAQGGTGLGLSVVKQIVDLHGGRISLRNAAAGGLIITVRLKAATEHR